MTKKLPLKFKEIIDTDLYFRRDMNSVLLELGLPSSRPTLLMLEADGVIDAPKRHMKVGKGFWRMYTGEEIKQNVERIRAYYDGKNK